MSKQFIIQFNFSYSDSTIFSLIPSNSTQAETKAKEKEILLVLTHVLLSWDPVDNTNLMNKETFSGQPLLSKINVFTNILVPGNTLHTSEAAYNLFTHPGPHQFSYRKAAFRTRS